MGKPNEVDTPEPIMHTDPLRRLDAIVRRHGGAPKPLNTAKFHPTPPKRACAGQLALDT